MTQEKEFVPIPLWLDRKLLKRMGVMGAENKDLLKGYLYGSHECFEILWPQIELMKTTLSSISHTKIFNEVNVINVDNLFKIIREAQDALDKVEAMK